MLRVAIDASNIRAGGGVTHLTRLLEAAEPEVHGIESVSVWADEPTLLELPRRSWLNLRTHIAVGFPFPAWLLWQRTALERDLSRTYDLLFVPGGVYTGCFRPLVAMSQNLLPFDSAEAARYGWSRTRARLYLLRRAQTSTFRAADGVIFVTPTARDVALSVTGPLQALTTVIPHGTSFADPPAARPKLPISDYGPARPFRWLYLSTVEPYKHQVVVAEAVARLRNEGLPVALDLVGPAYRPALRELRAALDRLDPERKFLSYHGPAARTEVAQWYAQADAFVFASSCETFGIVLLDAMAAGLPVVSLNHGVMRDVLGDAGVYFDRTNPAAVASAMRSVMMDHEERQSLAHRAQQRARTFTWEACARQTFRFLSDVAHNRRSAGT